MGPRTHAHLLGLRTEFPILGQTTYLINNSLGAMPRAVEDKLADYARAWRERGVRAWHEGWWEMPVDVGDLVARILGVGVNRVMSEAQLLENEGRAQVPAGPGERRIAVHVLGVDGRAGIEEELDGLLTSERRRTM